MPFMYLYEHITCIHKYTGAQDEQEVVQEVCELYKRDRLSYLLKDCASNDGAFRMNLRSDMHFCLHKHREK